MMSDHDENPFDFGEDPRIDDLLFKAKAPEERVAVIRTSDRIGFKRCRRRWGWQSHLKGNLTASETAAPLWFGSGIHFVLEDFHAHKQFATPVDAWKAYVKATKRFADHGGPPLPFDWAEHFQLGVDMMDYYSGDWMISRDPLETYVVDGVPQVEVHVQVDIPFKSPHYDRVVYGATLDRVIIDEYGNLWVVEYKTAKRIQTLFFQTDPQVSAYCWLARHIYDRPISGVIYQQHLKTPPKPPRTLANGKLSTAKQQLTTHRLYRRALINVYGDVAKAPVENVDFLNALATSEDDMKDKFIRRDKLFRNDHQAESEGAKLMLELEDMLNPDLPLYPNATRDCQFQCSFQGACVSMDDGGDWQYELEIATRQRDASFDSWRKYLPDNTRTFV